MSGFILQRLGQSAVAFVLMTLILFTLVFGLGNPIAVLADPSAPPELLAEYSRQLGLDRPFHEQYWLFLQSLARGELGVSYASGRPALATILERLPATLELVFVAFAITLVIGLPLGVIAATSSWRWLDRLVSAASIVGISLPVFWIGLMLVVELSVNQRLFPANGRGPEGEWLGIQSSLFTVEGLRHLVLPGMTLAIFPLAMLVRLLRAGIRENIQLEYMRFARSLGVSRLRRTGYLLRNIAAPIVTIMGMLCGTLIAFSVVTETVFAWPGSGKLIIDSIRVTDRPMIIAYTLLIFCLFVAINLVVDVLQHLIDPRARSGQKP